VAEILLAHSLKKSRLQLYTEEIRLHPATISFFWQLVRRCASGTPLQYLLNRLDFYGLPFKVSTGCFIPRPETELLVAAAINFIKEIPPPQKILEIGTGCGAISLVLAHHVPTCMVIATEISPAALKVAGDNRKRLHLKERVRFYRSDLFPPGHKNFDLIVSNPPYIPSREIPTLPVPVRKEPVIALNGGKDGLAVIKRILNSAAAYLKPGGVVLLEIGNNQSERLRKRCFSGLRLLFFRKDLAGIERIAIYRRVF